MVLQLMPYGMNSFSLLPNCSRPQDSNNLWLEDIEPHINILSVTCCMCCAFFLWCVCVYTPSSWFCYCLVYLSDDVDLCYSLKEMCWMSILSLIHASACCHRMLFGFLAVLTWCCRYWRLSYCSVLFVLVVAVVVVVVAYCWVWHSICCCDCHLVVLLLVYL